MKEDNVLHRYVYDEDLKIPVHERGVVRGKRLQTTRSYDYTDAVKVLFVDSEEKALEDFKNSPRSIDTLTAEGIQEIVQKYAQEHKCKGYFFVPELDIWSHTMFLNSVDDFEFGPISYIVQEVESRRGNKIGLIYRLITPNGTPLHAHSFEGVLEILARNPTASVRDIDEFSAQERELINALTSG